MFSIGEGRVFMAYDEFKAYMIGSVSKIFAGSNYEVVVEMSTRPGVEPYEIISVKEKIGKNVYSSGFGLQSCYDEYVNGAPLGELVSKRVKEIEGVDEWFKKVNFDHMNDFERFKGNVIVRPLGFATNEKALRNHVYRRAGDIALTVYMLLNNEKGSMATAKIPKEAIAAWNLPEDYVFDYALGNTAILFEPYIVPFEHIMQGASPKEYPDESKYLMRPGYLHSRSQLGVYMMFANNSVNAATAVFYPGVLRRLSEIVQTDLYVVAPYMSYVAVHVKGTLPLEDIKDSARKMKHSPFEKKDEFLTENVYRYSRKNDALVMM